MKIYFDPDGDHLSLLVINTTGQIRRLYVPFRVICVVEAPGIALNSVVYVEAVLSTRSGLLIYQVFNRPFPYHHFHIVIRF